MFFHEVHAMSAVHVINLQLDDPDLLSLSDLHVGITGHIEIGAWPTMVPC